MTMAQIIFHSIYSSAHVSNKHGNILDIHNEEWGKFEWEHKS